MEALACTKCGGSLKQSENGVWRCDCCNAQFTDRFVEKYKTELRAMLSDALAQERQARLANLRRMLWQEAHRPYIHTATLANICHEIKKMRSDDFAANFYEEALSDDSRRLAEFLNGMDTERFSEYVEDVIEFCLRSLRSEDVLPLKYLIDRAYKNKDLTLYERALTAVETEAEKVDRGLYDLDLPRDAFIAYSSKDAEAVIDLTRSLEEQGISCFVALRNLQHGRGAVDNYQRALNRAMDNCAVFVFVSSKNSRSICCDAMRKELAYIKERDLENAPPGYRDRAYYAQLPLRYKKPRVEYRLDNERNTVADAIVKEFFGTLEYCYSKETVALRVAEYLMESVSLPSEEEADKRYSETLEELKSLRERIAEMERAAGRKTDLTEKEGDRVAFTDETEAILSEPSVKNPTADFDVVYGTLRKYKGLSSVVTVPEQVVAIGDRAFFARKNVTRIVLPKGLKEIGSMAFYGCSALKEIVIGENVESIGWQAFKGCSGLDSVTFVNASGWKSFVGSSEGERIPEEMARDERAMAKLLRSLQGYLAQSGEKKLQ